MQSELSPGQMKITTDKVTTGLSLSAMMACESLFFFLLLLSGFFLFGNVAYFHMEGLPGMTCT